MDHYKHFHSFSHGIRHAFAHGAITLLAVGIAFSLPVAAKYILFNWWPKIEENSQLMMITEIGFATALVLLLNISKIAWDGRRSMRMAKLASLVYAREGEGWMSRWKAREMRRKLASARDVYIMSITGYDTFVSEKSELKKTLEQAYEIRVMLANPYSNGSASRVKSMENPDALLQTYREEIEASIAYLGKLAAAGKKIMLKLYENAPFWKLVVTGEYVWVQFYHDGREVKTQPEYVFGLQHDNPQRGFFAPFYNHFLGQWNDPCHPEFNFDTRELVYRNGAGNEVRREAFPGSS
ncbi:MAG: hypothetical protein PHX38_07330 [Sulfuricella sp.]|nr:hypothetical protein [Sulfuricella sp.]